VMLRILAVDWSGAAQPATQRDAIWIAEVELRNGSPDFVRVRPGYTRQELVGEVKAIVERATDERVVIALDFAFSLPHQAIGELGLDTAQSLWKYLDGTRAENWLGTDPPRVPVQADPMSLRCTEEVLTNASETDPALRRASLSPKPTMDLRPITGNVGRQTIRGIPLLNDLRNPEELGIWPWDEPTAHYLLEIYPTLLHIRLRELARSRNLKRRASRGGSLRDWRNSAMFLGSAFGWPVWAIELASANKNAFDAVVSATAMAHYHERLPHEDASPPGSLWEKEGVIWDPGPP
jgi:hypothetical protein